MDPASLEDHDARASERGRVEAIHVASGKGEPMRSVERIRGLAGLGLEGDRYAVGTGHYSADRRVSRDLTLVEGEVLDELVAAGIGVVAGETRRNVTTRGVALNDLVGRRFRIGAIECRGTRLCEPCRYLADITGKPLLRPLVHRGGVRADILTDGEIAVGDSIETLPEEGLLGVAVVLVRGHDVLLGLRRGRSRGAGMWSTPGGKLESGEPIETCARRELMEETGLTAGSMRMLGEGVDLLPSGELWRTAFVRAEWAGGEPTVRERDTCERWAWHPAADLPSPLSAPVRGFASSPLMEAVAGLTSTS